MTHRRVDVLEDLGRVRLAPLVQEFLYLLP